MSVIQPDEFDPAEDVYQPLIPRKKEVLVRLFNLFCDEIDHRPIDDGAFTAGDLRKILADPLQQQTRLFLEDYQRLRDETVRTDPALEYLAENYELDTEELEIQNRYDLLLLLYENELIEELDVLIARSRIREYAALRGQVLDDEIRLESIESGISRFHEQWNDENEENLCLVLLEYQSPAVATVKMYLESGPRYPEVFSFRQNGDSRGSPIVPEVTHETVYQLKTQRLQIEVGDGESEVIFTKPLNGWRSFVSGFFSIALDVDDVFEKFQAKESAVAKEIETEIVEIAEDGGDPITGVKGTIDGKRDEAFDRVDEMDLPKEHRDDLMDRIGTIRISGSNITDDQSIATSRFQLVATLEQLFGAVDALEDGFKDLIRKADSDKQSFVLTVSDRPVTFKDGAWQSLGPGRLPARDRRALEIFFDQA